MNGVLVVWVVGLGLFCALALGAGTWLFRRARDKQHADWAAVVEDEEET